MTRHMHEWQYVNDVSADGRPSASHWGYTLWVCQPCETFILRRSAPNGHGSWFFDGPSTIRRLPKELCVYLAVLPRPLQIYQISSLASTYTAWVLQTGSDTYFFPSMRKALYFAARQGLCGE